MNGKYPLGNFPAHGESIHMLVGRRRTGEVEGEKKKKISRDEE